MFFFTFIPYLYCRFFPTTYDPLIETTAAADQVAKISGWANNHLNKINIDTFGDISIITYNLYDKKMEFSTNSELMSVKTLIDRSHPVFMNLQGVDKELVNSLHSFVNGTKHYQMTTVQNSYIDVISGTEYFLPILYDASVAKMINNGYFVTSDIPKIMYGSWARFKHGDHELVIVNMDIFSSFKEVSMAEFSNIAADILTDPKTNESSIILAGNIMTMPGSIEKLLKKDFINLIETDPNNDNLSRTTMSMQNTNNDNIQRDYILLRDRNNVLQNKYTRILSNFSGAGNNFPVHAILSYKRNKKSMQKKNKRTVGQSIVGAYKKMEEKIQKNAISGAAQAMFGVK